MPSATFKADLRTFPHFFSPQDSAKVPSLREMVEMWRSKSLRLISLTACHTATGGIDHRFEDYMNQLKGTEGFEVKDQRDKGHITLTNIYAGVPVTILNSQQVRTSWEGMPIDINIMGSPKIISPTRDLYETIREARDINGIISLCHINENCGLKLEKALELYYGGKVDAIEVQAKSPATGKNVREALELQGIKPLAVTGGHDYRQAGTSYIELPSFPQDFSIEWLRHEIKRGGFTPHYGSIGKLSRFLYRDRHIIASTLGNYLAGGKRREEFLKAVGLRRK